MKKRPIVLCIMDGYGISESINGNAVRLANTPNLDDLMAMYQTQLFQLVVCLLVYLMDKWEIVKLGI